MELEDYFGPQFCAARNIRKTGRVITRLYDEALKPTGLRISQFGLLATLYANGSRPVTHLAEELVLDRTTLTRNLKPLEKQGLVEIQSGVDRRTRIVGLTEAGRESFLAALPLWKEAQTAMLEKLGVEHYDRLLTGLSAIIALNP